MKIKKYEGRTEQAAMEKIRDELGPEAIVLSIKKTHPRGILAFFHKPMVEVTAAYDEKFAGRATTENVISNGAVVTPAVPVSFVEPELTDVRMAEIMSKNIRIIEQEEIIHSLENKLKSNEDLLGKVVAQLSASQNMTDFSTRRYENSVIQLFYDTLIEQGVVPEVAVKILEDANAISGDEIGLNIITKVVYNTIMNVLGEPQPLEVNLEDGVDERESKAVFFLGPTGVGKTTTIAKLSSAFILNNNLKVGLVTADTYRIAAVEQLKTYGEILGIDVCVVYKAGELCENLERLCKTEDIILIDTAGRSHRNKENLEELREILETAPGSRKFLVLSATTNYEDLINIVNIYAEITDFELIFTKLDETACLGSILNICWLTGKKMSYVAYGQNVPDDIEIAQSEKIAKALLGFGGGVFW